MSKGSRRGGAKESFKPGNSILCLGTSGAWLSREAPPSSHHPLSPSGVEFTDRKKKKKTKKHSGSRAMCLSSDFYFGVLSEMASFVPTHGMEERLIYVQSEGTTAGPVHQ